MNGVCNAKLLFAPPPEALERGQKCKYHLISITKSISKIFLYQTLWGAQWLSGRVLDSRLKGRGFEPHRRHCVVVLEQDIFILAYYWFYPGRPVPVQLKDCWWDVKNQIKQTNTKLCVCTHKWKIQNISDGIFILSPGSCLRGGT